jgi:hypothetical protein
MKVMNTMQSLYTKPWVYLFSDLFVLLLIIFMVGVSFMHFFYMWGNSEMERLHLNIPDGKTEAGKLHQWL